MPPDTENGSDMQPSQDFDPENAPSGGNAPQNFDPGNAPSDGDAPQKMQGGPGGGGNSELYIKITGGTLTVSADGDGLDSNGGLLVTGGTTIVYGPTSDGDSALDYDGSAIVTGGTLAAIGSAGMTESFDEASTQPVITYYCTETQSADTIRQRWKCPLHGHTRKSLRQHRFDLPRNETGRNVYSGCRYRQRRDHPHGHHHHRRNPVC